MTNPTLPDRIESAAGASREFVVNDRTLFLLFDPYTGALLVRGETFEMNPGVIPLLRRSVDMLEAELKAVATAALRARQETRDA